MSDDVQKNILNDTETTEPQTDAVVSQSETETVKKKRGRKPNPNKKVYFGPEEEAAFIEYVNSTDQRYRDKLFSDKLYFPFTKMIESIIRRYNLFTPDEDFDDTFFDTMSFLITKINNFDTTKNYKAYSYCGTICKNYLILKRTQYAKKIKRQITYDGSTSFFNDVGNQSDKDNDKQTLDFNTELISNTISELQTMLLPENAETLTDNEKIIGEALLEMMMNWEEIFKYLGSRKFNKSCVLQFMRDYTNLSTPDIREGMKKYKELYIFTKQKLIDE